MEWRRHRRYQVQYLSSEYICNICYLIIVDCCHERSVIQVAMLIRIAWPLPMVSLSMLN